MPDSRFEAKLFPDYAHADAAVTRLTQAGIDQSHISVMASPDGTTKADGEATSPNGAVIGGAAGGVIGGILAAAGVAVVAATGGLAAPLVAGPLAAILASGVGAGVVGGTIFGGLMDLGLQADEVQSTLNNGGVLVAVEPDSDAQRTQIRTALNG